MKFGVDAPWYDDPVERTAFNLYAMNCTEIEEIAKEIVANFSYDIEGIEVEDIVYSYNVDDETAQAIYDKVQELIDE